MGLDKANATPAALGEPSEVTGRYLEAIYYMASEGEAVRSSRLADWLGVSRPTVAVALQRMLRDGQVRMDGHKEIELTDRGRTQAEAIVRRHRIVERWLTDWLGLDWVTADEEAARLEHAVSELVEQRLYEVLGRPQSCPHGNPIPGLSEAAPGEARLDTAGDGDRVRITRISEVGEREVPLLLGYLGERRLVPGTRLEVLERDPVGGSMRLRVNDERELAIARETAARIWVITA